MVGRQVDFASGILCLDDSTLEKPYSKRNDLVYRHWSGKKKQVVAGINLITLLWTEGDRWVPVDYRIFDKDRDRRTLERSFLGNAARAPARAALIRRWFVLTVGMPVGRI